MTDMETNVTRSHRARRAALITPLILVNAAAVYGQGGWAWDHLVPADIKAASTGAAVALCLLFAAAVESIGIYLAAEAHAALMAGDASVRLRVSSYAVGGLVGTLNFAHFAGQPGYRPNPLAVTFGLLSAISPWLWSIHSRSLNRDRLRDLGQVDPRAVRFSPLRWALFPVRTWRAFRLAVWAGIVSPVEAVKAADARRGNGRRPVAAMVGDAVLGAPLDAARAAIADTVADIEAVAVASGVSAPASDPWVYSAPVAAIRADMQPVTVAAPRRTPARTLARPPKATDTAKKAATPVATKAAKILAKTPDIKQADLAAKLGVSERTLRRHLNPPAPATEPATGADSTPATGPVNGHDVPELVNAN